MEHVCIKKVALLFLVFSIGFTACNTNSIDPKDDSIQLAEIAELLDVEFPEDARIVFSEKNDRNKETAYHYIIFTPTPIKFNMPPTVQISSKTPIESLKKVVKRKNLGELKDKWTYYYEGEMKIGSWKVYQTNFETGSYLEVSQLFF